MPVGARDSFRLLEALKEIAKRKGIRYQDLAETLDVSLPTIKRWLNGEGIGISDLLELCGALGLELSDLASLAVKRQPREFRFTQEQERYFAAHPACLAYLFELRSGLRPVEIERKHRLSRRSSLAYLRVLERQDLIERDGVERARVKIDGSILWSDHGPLGLTFSREMIREYAARAIAAQGKETSLFLSLCGRNLTEADYRELQEDFKTLESKYRERSEYNTKVLDPSTYEKVSYCVIADQWDPEVFSRVTEPPVPQSRTSRPMETSPSPYITG